MNNQKINSYNIGRESFIVVDPPSTDYPVYIIAYFEGMGYCVYKAFENEDDIRDVKSIEKMMGFNKRNSFRKTPKDRIIIKVSYPDSFEYDILTRHFFLIKPNLTNTLRCMDVIYNMWNSLDRAKSSMNLILQKEGKQ